MNANPWPVTKLSLAIILWFMVSNHGNAEISPVPDKINCAVADRQDFQIPDLIQISGWLGSRITANEANRLVKLDPNRLLEGYRKRPGRQSWDGEHVGKWLHAATLAWVYSGDPELRKKLDYTVSELAKCQMEDGYLGTYLEKDRWTEWDVWAHKYNLIGLITYMRYTGNLEPLSTCRRMGDLLCRVFGDAPGKRDIIKAGEHVGLAPTSVLEPMVLLYRLTGEPRYLDFSKYILRAWEQPNGPKVISTLLTQKRVDKVGNGKAYEMLSCLNGALEYYRTVGEQQILNACLNAWSDIVANRLYITGAASYGELFHDDFDLPNVANVGETCVTVTWLQFNAQLLRLTGEARFAEQLEHVILNQLFGAQQCDGAAWGYYVQMEGKKPYSSSLDGHCCLSSGPRGIALIPSFVLSTDSEGVVVNLYDSSIAKLHLRNKSEVEVVTKTSYPADGQIKLKFSAAPPEPFTLKLRVPAWCRSAQLKVGDESFSTKAGSDGYVAIRRAWKKGDEVSLLLTLEPSVVVGNHKNEGKAAILYGPLVLAADQATLGSEERGVSLVALSRPSLDALDFQPEAAPNNLRCWSQSQVFRVNAIARRTVGALKAGEPLQIQLVPFADAGGRGSQYKVWIPIGQLAPTANVLRDGAESRSRKGNADGSINDEDLKSYVVTFDGKKATEDWFAVTLESPVVLTKIVFTQGRMFHDGGWFDTSAGKPLLQSKITKDGPWENLGELRNYPATTPTQHAGLNEGDQFTFAVSPKVKAIALRIIAKPASGDNPQQAFSSCAELEAFAEE